MGRNGPSSNTSWQKAKSGLLKMSVKGFDSNPVLIKMHVSDIDEITERM